MDLNRLSGVPYFMEVFSRCARELPEQVMLVDDLTSSGWTRRRVDEVSGQIYDHLVRHGIGREDFVLIKLPRGVLPVIAVIGVWKAGAACVTVEDDYAPERIAFIERDCGCRLTIDVALFERIERDGTYRPGFVHADDHDACFAIYTSGSTGSPKGVCHEYGNIYLNAALQNVDTPAGMPVRMGHSPRGNKKRPRAGGPHPDPMSRR